MLDPTKIDEYQEGGYVRLEGIITGEPLDYYRELIGRPSLQRRSTRDSGKARLRAELSASL